MHRAIGHTRCMPDNERVPTWPELIILVFFGESEEQPFTGVVEVDDTYEDEDDDLAWPRTVRVHKRGRCYRVETLDGEVLYIKGADRSWRFSPGADVPAMTDHADDEELAFGSYGYAIERPEPTRWRGNDFSLPTGPAQRTTYLGRDAWRVELAPPPHKPAPIVLTVDAVTGMQLRWHSERFGDVFRWIELEHDVTHDDSLFVWEGDAISSASISSENREADDARHAQDMADRARWMASRRLAQVEVTVRVDLFPHEWSDEDGSFFASFNTRVDGMVARRPHDDDEWDIDAHYDHMERWSDGTWDWVIGSDADPSHLAGIRRQLSEPRPDDA